MQGIFIPESYQHLTKRERNGREYNEAAIRDYIQAHEGKVMSSKDFIAALGGLTTAPTIVTRLRKQGRITRTPVKTGKPGKTYTYKWINGGVVDPLKRGEPVLTKPRTAFATDYELKSLDRWFLKYCDTHSLSIPDVNKFRRWVHEEAGKENG